jgi:hypothetical protein
VGACAGPLDWETPWQRWPIASGHGICIGYACGALLALAWGQSATRPSPMS